MGLPFKYLSQELLVKMIKNSASSIKPKAKAQPGRPPHAQRKQEFKPDDQLPLQLVVNAEKSVPAKQAGRRKSSQADSNGDSPLAKEKQILSAIRKEAGAGLNVLARVQKLHPNSPFDQVGAFFQEFIIPSATGRKRTVSIKTEELYVVQMQVMVRQLSDLNMALQNLSEFSSRHVHALTRHYERQGLSSSSLQKKNTVLRRFGTWIGKPDMTPRLADMVVDPTRAKRSYSALESKAWTSNGVDPEEVIRRVEAESMVTGLQMRIQHAFGLRPCEVVMLKPQTADQGRGLFVTDGTKGGRARMVPIDSPLKRSLIEKAKVYAATNPRGVLTDRLQPLHKAINRYYYIAKKAGVGKNGLGITLHGLRHEFANNVFKEITGVNSPVNGGRVEDPELLRKAMQETSNQLGHSRLYAGSAYLGSNRHINYIQFKNIRYITATIEGSASVIAAVRLAGPSTWWVTGEAAQGKGIQGGVQLSYRAAVNPGQAQDEADMAMARAAMAVALAVGKALGVLTNVLPDSALAQSGHIERLELIGLWRESLDPSGNGGNEASTSQSSPTAAPDASAEETGLFGPST